MVKKILRYNFIFIFWSGLFLLSTMFGIYAVEQEKYYVVKKAIINTITFNNSTEAQENSAKLFNRVEYYKKNM